MAAMLDLNELRTFEERGLVIHRQRLKRDRVDQLLGQLPLLAQRIETVAWESDGKTPRALHGGHEQNTEFDRLTRLSALLWPARQIVRDHVYVYQFKVNLKAAFAGDCWPWHQDYSFWAKEDGMPAPKAVTVAIFLDDINEFNGPIYFIPGSHRSGCHDSNDGQYETADDHNWEHHVGASLSYRTDPNKVIELAAEHGLSAPKGPRGTILFFDSNIVHASPSNISPMHRRLLFITYNGVHNRPRNTHRPEFLVNRNAIPLEPLEENDTEFVSDHKPIPA
jgi:hypothetical protein